MRSHALCSTGVRKEQWKPEQIGEIQGHTDRKERQMNIGMHWLCGLFAVLLTLLIARTVSADTISYTGTETTVTLGPGAYDITAYGAQGGRSPWASGGLGAEMEAQFRFTKETTLTLLVGGAGTQYSSGGGGGGSFLAVGRSPLIVAGGGGGGGLDGSGGGNGQTTTSGGSSPYVSSYYNGAGGAPGEGGSPGGWAYGSGGGGGFYGDGVGGGDFYPFHDSTAGPGGQGGFSFLDGGTGGIGGSEYFEGPINGGYGGGGGGAYYGGGGGGGYSGGGGSGYGGGGGGGSYIDSSAIAIGTELSGVASPNNSPNGEIIITQIPPASWASAVSGNWSDSTKWTGAVPNSDGATAVISASTTAALTVTLNEPVTLGTLFLGSGNPGVGYTLSGGGTNTLTFSNTGGNIAATISVIDGTHAINAPVILASNLVVTSTGSTPWTLSFGTAGSITDNGNNMSLNMSASNGTLILSGSNSYTGGTTINAGTLIFASSQAIGGSGANVNVNYGATVAAGYPLDQNFLSRLVLSSSGVAALAADSSNNLNFSGLARLRLGAVGTANYSGTLTPNGTTYVLGGGGGVLTVSGPLTGANSLDVGTNGTPTGTVILAGVQSYTGTTQVSGGTLVIQGTNASSSFTANNDGTLQFSDATINLGSAYVQARSGALVQYQNANISGGYLRGPGSHVLAAGSANSFNATTINNGAVLQQNGITKFTDVTNAGQLNSNGTANLTWQGGSNASSGAITVNNSAIVNVSEWYNDGVITVNNGGLLNNSVSDLVSGGGSQVFVNSGGTLNADSNAEGVAIDLRESLLVNNGTVTGATNVYYGATLQGSGAFGPINVFEGGTLAIASSAGPLAASLAISSGSIAGAGQSASPITVANVTFITPNLTDKLTLSGNLTGIGPITKSGSGLLILSGDNSYGGGTTVNAGTLEVLSRSALPDGTSLTVGAGGTLIFDPSAAGSPITNSSFAVAVPESSTVALLGIGSIGLLNWAWRKRRSSRKAGKDR
jgi:fibronectin-binding autotransporter adhesin